MWFVVVPRIRISLDLGFVLCFARMECLARRLVYSSDLLACSIRFLHSKHFSNSASNPSSKCFLFKKIFAVSICNPVPISLAFILLHRYMQSVEDWGPRCSALALWLRLEA